MVMNRFGKRHVNIALAGRSGDRKFQSEHFLRVESLYLNDSKWKWESTRRSCLDWFAGIGSLQSEQYLYVNLFDFNSLELV